MAPSEILFSVIGTPFVQTRATEIGKGDLGWHYGTIYICQTPSDTLDKRMWAHGTVAQGKEGELTYADDAKLYWVDMKTKYYFQAISVPVHGDDSSRPGGVTFTHDVPYEKGGHGTVTFGGYDTGLEYFVGVSLPARNLENGATISMTMARQVGKILFDKIIHIDAHGSQNHNVDSCEIIFPNLPSTATFSLDSMYRIRQSSMKPEGLNINGRNYVCLYHDGAKKGVKMAWKKAPNERPSGMSEVDHLSKTQAIYLPTFLFWDGKDNKPENQSGFFIVRYNNKNYTGNLDNRKPNGDTYLRLWPTEQLRLSVKLQDEAAQGGGDGSAIAEWNIAEEENVLHYPVAGIYTPEDAAALLEALQSGKAIPERFYSEDSEGRKVVRLFANIDWSAANGTLDIPDGFVLVGQGYNVKLGEGGSISGAVEGTLYINGKRYEDGAAPAARTR